MLIDVHTHLDALEDIDTILQRAKEAGVGVIISNGTNSKTNRITLDLTKKYPVVKAALGLYPTDALQMTDEQIDEEFDFIRKNKDTIIALGEVGVDYHWITDVAQQKKERENFEKVMAFAEKIKKPIIVHSRKAEVDTVDLLRSSKLKKVVLHCFGGNMKIAAKAIDAGYWFSIPTNILRDNHFQKLVEMLPLKQLLTETDAPYLGPEKNVPNEPANIARSVPIIAKIKSVTKEEMENIIFANYQRVFL